jgi:hypothetical protein
MSLYPCALSRNPFRLQHNIAPAPQLCADGAGRIALALEGPPQLRALPLAGHQPAEYRLPLLSAKVIEPGCVRMRYRFG